jgi:hypothetical protein
MNLTHLETVVLTALFKSAEGNGHDFGFIDDARGLVRRNQLSGIVSSLVQKNVITVHDPVTTDSGRFEQFTWNIEVSEVKKLLEAVQS